MEKHFKKHIEEDQQQLLAEARGGVGPGMSRGLNSGRTNTKGVRLSPFSLSLRRFLLLKDADAGPSAEFCVERPGTWLRSGAATIKEC